MLSSQKCHLSSVGSSVRFRSETSWVQSLYGVMFFLTHSRSPKVRVGILPRSVHPPFGVKKGWRVGVNVFVYFYNVIATGLFNVTIRKHHYRTCPRQELEPFEKLSTTESGDAVHYPGTVRVFLPPPCRGSHLANQFPVRGSMIWSPVTVHVTVNDFGCSPGSMVAGYSECNRKSVPGGAITKE